MRGEVAGTAGLRSRWSEMPTNTPVSRAGQPLAAPGRASSSASQVTSSSRRCWGSICAGFARRDAEELAVELVDPVEEAAPARVRSCPARRVRVVEARRRPSGRREPR